jgi:hypothetical protein
MNEERTAPLGLKATGAPVHLTADQLRSLRDLTIPHQHGVELTQLESMYVRLDLMDAEGTTVTKEKLLFPLGPSR